MRQKKKLRERVLSLFLVLLLLTGNAVSVRAEDPADEGAVKAEQQTEPQTEPETNQETDSQTEPQLQEEKPEKNAESDGGAKKEQTHKVEPKKEQAPKTDVKEDKESKENKEKSLTGYGMTVTLQIEAYGETLEQGAKVVMPDTYKTFEEYGLKGIKEPEKAGYTVLHVMAEYCEQRYGKGAAAEKIGVGNGFVSGFLDLPRKSTIMFLKNRASLQVGAQEEKVHGGDLISVVDVWANINWSEGGQYSWFETEQMTAEAGNPFSVKLNVQPLMWGEAARLSGATVKVIGSGGKTVAEGKTNGSGTASLVVEEPGTYTVTAERQSGSYDADNSHPWDLVPPHGTLVVTPGKELTDEEAVQKAGELLEQQLSELIDLDQITDSFILPDTGRYETSISWESSDPDSISINGTEASVTRPVGADQTVILTATISRDTQKSKAPAQARKEIPVVVVGKELFKELSVDCGTLEYDKSVNEYTVYVKKDIEKVTVSGTAAEGVSVVKCETMKQDGTPKTDSVIAAVNPEFKIESWLTGQDGKDLTPQNITLEALGPTAGKVTITVKRGNPGKPLPELPDVTWGQHLGDKNNNAVVDAKAPSGAGELLWESFSGAPDIWGSVYAGTPILVNQSIYAVRNHKIEMLDAKTGKVKKSASLQTQAGYYSNIIYGGGMIFVPLGNGDVQCFHASTLKSLYVITSPAALGEKLNVYGAMHYDDGKLYVGYSDGGFTSPTGCYAAYDTRDMDVDQETEPVFPLWTTEEKGQSYYGSGAITTGEFVVIAGDSGVVSVRNAETGAEISSCQLTGWVRSSLVYADGFVWAATQGKKIYKLSLSEEGIIKIAAEGKLPSSTSSTPVVTGGKVYVTGGTFEDGGFLAVYDMKLNLLAKVKTENALNTPTVTTAYKNVRVYFTENGKDGSLYMAEITGSNKIQIKITKIYTPAHPQYSMSKVVIGADGTIYYGNDAGYLYAIVGKTGSTSEKPEKPDAGKQEQTSEKEEEKNEQQTGFGQTGGGSRTNIVHRSTYLTQVQNFKPVKRTMRVSAAGKTKKSAQGNIVSAIKKSLAKNEQNLTIKNPPEVIGKEVFAELAKHPNFRLIVDCGTYTLSMKGSDITNVNGTLSTRLMKIPSSLSKEDAQKYGNYQQLLYAQEGVLPGRVTAVYKLGKQFSGSESLYLYELANPEQAQQLVVKKPYGMFVLNRGGEYILSDEKIESAIEPETVEISQELFPEETGTEERFPVWIYVVIALGAGALLGGLMVGIVLSTRKRKDTWEE